MSFEIKNKVALISGGASGIGFSYAQELLRNEIRGVTIADVNDDSGRKALEEIEKEFGPNKAIFVKTDVTNKQSFESAFKKTIEKFKNLDILINNAGIFNDAQWEKELAVNINGVIHGILLGLENYFPKYKTGTEGVIVNTSSTSSLQIMPGSPIYSTTKHAVNGLTKSFGDEVHFKRTKVRVLALCPGYTETPLTNPSTYPGKMLNQDYDQILLDQLNGLPLQEPKSVALGLIKIIKSAKSGTVWVVESGLEAYEYIFPPIKDFAPK